MFIEHDENAIKLTPVLKKQWNAFLKKQSPYRSNWLKSNGFQASSGELCIMPNEQGGIEEVLLGLDHQDEWHAYAKAAVHLPKGSYCVEKKLSLEQLVHWGLAQYQFTRYKKSSANGKRDLVLKQDKLRHEVLAIVDAISLVRTLINTPTEDMGPAELASEMVTLAKTYQAQFQQYIGKALLENNFPAVHAVGRAASSEPRLMILNWGKVAHPRISLVGKGVCFDTGGLDIKPSSAMRLMKKDMGGAAHALGLAKLIMAMDLPVQLQVIIPAVENAIAGNAYRPGDVVHTRKGLSVEIGNTDAEGRVIMADALALASESEPEMIIDFATLTGAARVALGTDIAAFFSNDQQLASELTQLSLKIDDPIWQLPLYQPYLKLIQPEIADLSNSGESPYAGAITAALFLEQFVQKKTPWFHFDVMAWNLASKPGKPKGGEALALRAVYQFLKQRYGE